MSNEQMPAVAIPLSGGKRIAVTIGCIGFLLFLGMMSLSVSILMPTIMTGFDAMDQYALVQVLSNLAMVIMTPIGGKLGDILGRKSVMIISGIIAFAASVFTAVFATRSLALFIAMRCLCSLATGASVSLPFTIGMDIYERPRIPQIMGMLAGFSALATFAGSFIAGAIFDAGLGTLGLYVPLIPLLVGIILMIVFLPNKKSDAKPSIDFAGILIFTLTVTPLVLALNLGATMGWFSPMILSGFALALIMLFVLIKVENKAKEPIIPMHLFKNGKYVCVLMANFCAFFYMTTMMGYLPLAVQQVMQASVTMSGLLQLPRSIIAIIAPLIIGTWIAKKPTRCWTGIQGCLLLLTLSFIPMCFIGPSTSVVLLIALVGVTGIADSLRTPAISPLVQGLLEPKDIGIGIGLCSFFGTFSTLIASAVCGALFNIGLSQGDMAKGVNMGAMVVVAISAIGFLLVTIVNVRQNKQVQAKPIEQKG